MPGRSAEIAYVTLHVGLGTFQPLHDEQLRECRLHPESYSLTRENAERMRDARRLVAVGTTSVRTIETVLARRELREGTGDTELLITPLHVSWRGSMLTNFHLPETSLLLLVCALLVRISYWRLTAMPSASGIAFTLMAIAC